MNKCAVENVKNHIVLEMDMCKRAEDRAKEGGMEKEYIEMCRDMFNLYARFLAQLMI